MVDLHGLPSGLVTLVRDAAIGQHIGSVELAGVKTGGDGAPLKLYDLTLQNVTVAGYAADGGHDTAVAFDYGIGIETINEQGPDGSLVAGQTFAFDLARNGGSIAPISHDTLAAFAHSHDGVPLTYLLRVDGVRGDSTLRGYEGWFTVDEHTFGELTQLATGGGGGGGAGKPQFDPLVVDLHGLPSGLVTLLRDAATGQHIRNIELAGIKVGRDGAPLKLYDLTLQNVTVAGYAADGGHDTAVAFDYGSGTETIREQSPDGSLGAAQTFGFDLAQNGGSIAPVSHDTLAAFAHSHANDFPDPTTTNGSGTNTAAIIDAAAAQSLALIGQYAASSFAVAADGHGGPLITDPPSTQQLSLTQPHA